MVAESRMLSSFLYKKNICNITVLEEYEMSYTVVELNIRISNITLSVAFYYNVIDFIPSNGCREICKRPLSSHEKRDRKMGWKCCHY